MESDKLPTPRDAMAEAIRIARHGLPDEAQRGLLWVAIATELRTGTLAGKKDAPSPRLDAGQRTQGDPAEYADMVDGDRFMDYIRGQVALPSYRAFSYAKAFLEQIQVIEDNGLTPAYGSHTYELMKAPGRSLLHEVIERGERVYDAGQAATAVFATPIYSEARQGSNVPEPTIQVDLTKGFGA